MSRKRKAPLQAETAGVEAGSRRRDKKSKHEDKVGKAKAHDSGTSRPKEKRRSEPRNELLDEIKALGGDEGDFDLVKDVDSGDEESAQAVPLPVDKKLRKEIASLITDLGLEDHRESPVPSDELEDETSNGESSPVSVPAALNGSKRRLVCEPPQRLIMVIKTNEKITPDPRNPTRLARSRS